METHHRRALNRCMNDLTDDLDPSDVIFHLIESEIMSSEDNERINHQRNTRKKAVFQFVPLLQRKGPNAFKAFLRALERHNAYKHLVNKLQADAEHLIRQSDDKDVESSVLRSYHKSALLKCTVEILDNLDVYDVMSHMITKEIMTHDDRESIDQPLTRADKVIEFLATLQTKGGDAFDVFVEALEKCPFHISLASTLKELFKSFKESYDEGVMELLNETKDGESYDFILLKLSVAECLGRRDAFDLCDHFMLDGNSIRNSKYPMMSVVTLLCKENILLQDNIHNFLRASEELHLHKVIAILQAYNTHREHTVEIPIIVEAQVHPPSTEGNEVIRGLIQSKLRNKLWAFNIGKTLRVLFQRLYGIRYQRLEEGSLILQLVVPTRTALRKLNSDIEDGHLAQLLLSEIFSKEDVNIIQTLSPLSKVTLEVSLETTSYIKTMEELFEAEKEKAKKDICGDFDLSVFESFSEKIGFCRDSQRYLILRDLGVESHTPTPCNTFLRDVPRLCVRPGFSDNMTGERYNMRDFIYTMLINSETSVRCQMITEINSSNMAVPILLSGIAGNKPKLLEWVPSIIDKTGKEEGESRSSFLTDFIVSVVRIGETRLSKSSFLNTLYQFTQKRAVPSAFLFKDTTFPRPSFSQGCVEVVTAPSHGTDCFQGVISFLNLRGDCTKFKAQRKFLIRVSNLIIALIDESSVPDHKFAIDEIKTQSQNAIIVEVKQNDSCPAHEKNYPLDRRQESIVVDVLQLDVLCEEIYKEIIQCGEECKTSGKLKHYDVASFCENVGIVVETALWKHHVNIIYDQLEQPSEVQEQEEQENNIFNLKTHSSSVESAIYTNGKNHDENVQVDDTVHAFFSLIDTPSQIIYETDCLKYFETYFLKVQDEHEQNITTENYVRAVIEAIEETKAMQKIYEKQNL